MLANWNSLNDQNIDSVGAGEGQSWDEAGGASVNALGELYLGGSTTLEPGEAIALGNAYNTTTLATDLRFEYSTTAGATQRSKINYFNGLIDADFNNDLIVDGADLLRLQRNLGSTWAPLMLKATQIQMARSTPPTWRIS